MGGEFVSSKLKGIFSSVFSSSFSSDVTDVLARIDQTRIHGKLPFSSSS